MKIIQTVAVKQVLTENSKEALIESFLHNKEQLLKECEQLRFELKKMEKLKKYEPVRIKSHFTNEIDHRHEKIKQLDIQLEQIHKLPIGSEIKEKEVQSIIEIKVGDNWDDVTKARTIVIKDGIVEDIR
ncbi:YlqD family protein [Fredinandcohnia humi]